MTATADAQLLSPSDPTWREDPVNETLAAYDEQEPFLSGQERYHAFVSGIGAGKTNALVQRILLNVNYWNPGETGMVVAPTVPSLRNVLLPELRKWNVLNTCEYKPSENTLIFPNGARVILESADNQRKIERLRGPSIAWFGIDEAASIAHRAWEILVGRLRTGQYRNGFISTTPKGFNWVHDRFADAEDVNTVLGVPSTANPHTPEDYKASITEEFDGSFYEQEVLGQFTKFEGLVYPWFDEANKIDDVPEPGDYDEVIYGVDWGFSNPAVILAIVRQGDRWVVVDEWYERRCTDDDHAEAVLTMHDHWGPGTVYCDPSEPANIETFRRKDIAAQPAENDVTPGIQQVTKLQDDFRVNAGCQALINEFGQYQYKDDDERDEPVKQNDHAMDALRYALFSHHQTPGVDDLGWGT